jgi:hypothetical protein
MYEDIAFDLLRESDFTQCYMNSGMYFTKLRLRGYLESEIPPWLRLVLGLEAGGGMERRATLSTDRIGKSDG